MPLKLVTYNIRHGKGMDRRVSLPRIARVITDLEPDIVCLQEVDVRMPRSRFVDQALRLGELTGLRHVFGPSLKWPVGGLYGNAILTRWEIENHTVTRLPGRDEPRSALSVRCATPFGPIRVISTHWGLESKERAEQGDAVAKLVADCEIPVLLAGDFNESSEMRGHEPLRVAGLRRLGPDEPTYPSPDPTEWIDHVYGSHHWSVLGVAVTPSLASDHRPVLLELQLTPP